MRMNRGSTWHSLHTMCGSATCHLVRSWTYSSRPCPVVHKPPETPQLWTGELGNSAVWGDTASCEPWARAVSRSQRLLYHMRLERPARAAGAAGPSQGQSCIPWEGGSTRPLPPWEGGRTASTHLTCAHREQNSVDLCGWMRQKLCAVDRHRSSHQHRPGAPSWCP